MDKDEYKVRIGPDKLLVYQQDPDHGMDEEFVRQFQEAAASQPATLQDFFISLTEIQKQSIYQNMSTMQIELKNIMVAEHMSEETTAFTANLYINNKKIAFVKNDGRGGCTNYQLYEQADRSLLHQAEEYCKKLPPIVFPSALPEGKPFELPMDLENFIDDLLDKHLQKKDLEKFHKKMAKHQEDSILFGIPDKQYEGLRFKRPIAEILQFERGVQILKDTIRDKILPKLKEGETILNTNLPEELLKIERKKIIKPLTPKSDNIEMRPRRKK